MRSALARNLTAISSAAMSLAMAMVINGTAQAVDLTSFIADTISAHPDVQEQVHIFRQTVEDKTIARSGWRPRVDLEASVGAFESESPVTGPDSVDFESSRAELSVTQNLYDGFDTTNQIKQTDARINSALYELYDAADNVALEAAQAYLELLKQQRLHQLALKNVNSHEEILEQIRVRSLSGVGRRSQLEQTEGRVARAKASLIAQENNLQDAATQFHQVAGRYVDPASLVEPEPPASPALSIDDLTAQALQNHPALRVAEYNIEAAEHDYRRSLSKQRPVVDLRLAQEIGEDINGLDGSTDDLSLVLNMNLNLYNGGANRAEQRQKISVVHERQQFAARTRRQIINTLRLAWAADQALTSQLNYLQEHVDKSKATLASYQEEFFIGQRDLIDVLDAENELNSAQNNYAEAYFDFLAARYRIREGVGSLFESLDLDAQVKDQDLKISKVQAVGVDELPYTTDRDQDEVVNPDDQCDNSIIGNSVGRYGCEDSFDIDFEDVEVSSKSVDSLENQVNEDIGRAPEPVDDYLELTEDAVLTIPVKKLLENDIDSDDDTLTIEEFSQPNSGELALNAQGDLIYRPKEGFVGKDQFVYTVSDAKGNEAVSAVYLDVKSSDGLDLSRSHYVNFLFNETTLTDVSQNKVKNIINALADASSMEVWIFAHTDNVGTSRYNLSLSKRRADSLRDLLIASGIDGERVKANGIGESKPIADNTTDAGRAINRRGEFHFRTISSNSEG